MLLKVFNSSLELVALIDGIITPTISERINADFTFGFSANIKKDKIGFLTPDNIILVEGNYFRIAYYKRSGSSIDVECEHVSYDLIEHSILVDTQYSGTPNVILPLLLNGTGFTLGTTNVTAAMTFKVVNESNVRKVLIDYANVVGAELVFDKYTINFLQQRGVDNGVQFRTGKNLVGITEEIDTRGGGLKVSYDVDIIDLSQVSDFPYLAQLERAEIGDTINIIDEDMLIDIDARIVAREYNPIKKLNPRVEIGNYIKDIGDLLANTSSDIEIL